MDDVASIPMEQWTGKNKFFSNSLMDALQLIAEIHGRHYIEYSIILISFNN